MVKGAIGVQPLAEHTSIKPTGFRERERKKTEQ